MTKVKEAVAKAISKLKKPKKKKPTIKAKAVKKPTVKKADKKNTGIVVKKKRAPKVIPEGTKDGRPKLEVDWIAVEEMCKIHCTGEEIAAISKMSYDTLKKAIRKKYDLTFTQYYKEKSADGKMSLRRKQFKSAVEDGNTTMLVWMGKQLLGQRDGRDIDITSNGDSVAPTLIEIVAPQMIDNRVVDVEVEEIEMVTPEEE